MLEIVTCTWSVVHLKTVWDLLIPSTLEWGLLELSGMQFQNIVF